MRSKLLFIVLSLWAAGATFGWAYQWHQAGKMLELAEAEHDRRRIEEQFFDEFLTMRGVIVEDPHTSPFAGETVEEAPKHHIDH